MRIKDLKKDIEKGNMLYRGFCQDCGAKVEVTATLREDGTIKVAGDGSVYKVKEGVDSEYYFKCEECFSKDNTLRNFRKIEVYSRVVGYLRPVNQWNAGKQAEMDMRVEFTNVRNK